MAKEDEQQKGKGRRTVVGCAFVLVSGIAIGYSMPRIHVKTKDAASIETSSDVGGALNRSGIWDPVITVHGFFDDDTIADEIVAYLRSTTVNPRKYRVRTIRVRDN